MQNQNINLVKDEDADEVDEGASRRYEEGGVALDGLLVDHVEGGDHGHAVEDDPEDGRQGQGHHEDDGRERNYYSWKNRTWIL